MIYAAHKVGIVWAVGDTPPINHGLAHGEFAFAFDGYIAIFADEHFGMQQLGNHTRVMQGATV